MKWTILLTAVAAQNATSQIVQQLRNANIVPGIVPAFTASVDPLVITYPQAIVNYGNAINTTAAAYAPLINFTGPADTRYTLAMIDPDAPTPQNPTSAQIRHWLVADIEASAQPQNFSSGNVLSAYRGPMPPVGSPPHRYITFLLQQPAGANISLGNQTAIQGFNLRAFIAQNRLTIVSANYFNASRTNATASTSASGRPSATGTVGASDASLTTLSLGSLAVVLAGVLSL